MTTVFYLLKMIRVVILRHYCDTPAWIAVDDGTTVVEIIVSSKVIIYLSSFGTCL